MLKSSPMLTSSVSEFGQEQEQMVTSTYDELPALGETTQKMFPLVQAPSAMEFDEQVRHLVPYSHHQSSELHGSMKTNRSSHYSEEYLPAKRVRMDERLIKGDLIPHLIKKSSTKKKQSKPLRK